jgi:uncharacterized membrane protein YhaH (DUF805 family)
MYSKSAIYFRKGAAELEKKVWALKWPIGRISRSNFFFWLLGVNALLSALDWWAFGRLNLTLNLGFRFEAVQQYNAIPVWRTLLEVLLNLLLAALAVARLHDASYSARWLIALVGLAIASAFPFASALAAIALLGWVAIFFLPPSIGPNRYGRDPRGWKSREQFEQQQRDLAKQSKR